LLLSTYNNVNDNLDDDYYDDEADNDYGIVDDIPLMMTIIIDMMITMLSC
jgi:hypothetical protein